MVKALVLIALLLSGCTHTSGQVENPRQVWCDHNNPRRDATKDTPRAELDEINIHNMQGVKWCGWKETR